MPLDAQEQRCVELALSSLGQLYGGAWRISYGPTLDDLHQNEPSPECLLTNGFIDAAVEVKSLTGDEILRGYRDSIRSLKRSLTPTCGGYYFLAPAIDFRLPIDGALRRLLKKEIEREAPRLRPGETGAIRVPRKAYVSMAREDGPGFVYCCHNGTGHLTREVSTRITGSFILVDQDMPEHEFVTDAGREQFQVAVAEACQRCSASGDGSLEWYEEWALIRVEDRSDDDPLDKNGVWVIATTDAREMSASVAEAVEIVIVKAIKKFEQRWASKHVIVLDKAEATCTAERVTQALSWFAREELRNVDLILLTVNDEVSIVWQGRT